MELFKLFGTIAIDNAKAKKELSETSKEAKNTRTVFDKAFEEIGKKAVDVFKKDMPQSLKHTTEAIESQQNELNSLKKKYKDACLVFGENSKEAKSLGKQIEKLSTELKENKDKLKDAENAADKFDKSLDKVGKEAEDADGKVDKFSSTLGKLGSGVLKGTAIALGTIATSILAVGANAVKYNATMEQYATSFEVMTGSVEKANETMETLKELGAKTPFEFEDLASTTQLLMNYGFAAEEATDNMMMLGDIAQGDAEKMNRIAMAYGQMSSAGKVSLEDIKQMIEAGFNPLQEISETTGESMASLYDRISDGTLSIDEITASMQRSTAEGGKYFKSMEKQSKTVAGQLSTLKDNFNQMTGSIFNGVSQMIGSKALPVLIGWVDKLATTFEEEGLDGFLEAVGNILGEALTYLTEALPEFVDIGFGILNSLIDGLLDNVDKISEAGITLIESLVKGIAEFLPKFANTSQQLMYKFIAGLGQALPNLISTFTGMLLDLVNIAISNIPLVVQAGISIVKGLLEGILEAVPELLEALPELIRSLVDTLLEQIPLIIDTGVELLTALVDNLPLIIDTIVAVLPQIITEIIEALTSDDGIAKVVDAGVQLITAIVQNIDEIIATVVAAIPALITGIFGALTNADALGSLAQAGIDLIYSLLEGMQSVWGEVTGWFSSAMSSLLGWGNESFASTTGNITAKLSASANVGGGAKKIGVYADGGVVPKGQIAFLEGMGTEAVVPLDQNQKWVKAVAEDMNTALGTSGSNEAFAKLEAKFDALINTMQGFSNMQICLDSGVLVGELTEGIDASLGEVDNLRKRGG